MNIQPSPRAEEIRERLLAFGSITACGRSARPSGRSRCCATAPTSVALNVVDRAIQVHGGAGVSDDFPLAYMYAGLRTLRIADGPDEVHRLSVARQELRRQRQRREDQSA